jgi:Trypsin-like peptidase domain
VMTNCHVARVFADSGRDGGWRFQPGVEASVDFVEDPDAPGASRAARVEEVIGIHPALDLAVLRVTPPQGGDALRKPLTVMAGDPGLLEGRNVYVLGYPAPDRRNSPALQRAIFGDRFFIKRLQPGALMTPPIDATIRMHPCSTGAEPDDVLFHDASTLGGNSGSCVIDLESNLVLGVHFAGEYMYYNEAVALCRLADDPLLMRAAVNFEE